MLIHRIIYILYFLIFFDLASKLAVRYDLFSPVLDLVFIITVSLFSYLPGPGPWSGIL